MHDETTITLYGDERVLTASRASRFTPKATLNGQLVLTSHRLLFVPATQGVRGDIAFALDRITEVTLANLFLFFPFGIDVRLSDGVKERFVVPEREQWQQLIVLAARGELQAQLAELEAQEAVGAVAERPVVLVPALGQAMPIAPVVSWPAVVVWIALPLAFVPLFGLLPAVVVLVCAAMLVKGKLLHDRIVGMLGLGSSGLALLLCGLGVASLAVHGAFPEFPGRVSAGEVSIAARVVQIAVLVMSVVLHECGHGLAAYFAGDLTAVQAGRLKLNPIAHVELFGSIILPAILVISNSPAVLGWAKPVPVNPAFFRKRGMGNLAVSLAGVSANLLVAMVSLSLLAGLGAALHFVFPAMTSEGFWMAGFQTQISGVPASGVFAALTDVLKTAVLINLVLLAFNLLPIPPLDGSHVLELALPRSVARLYAKIRPLGMIILVVCIVAGVLDYLFGVVAFALAALGLLVGTICGLG
jgi:Zn-dependent protease